MQIIDGKKIAENIKDGIVKEILELKGSRPNLAIILVGQRKDSELYVSLKEREAKKVGIDTHLYRCAENTSEKEVLEMIDYLNKDELVDAILVQLPLPDGFDTDKVVAAIDKAKDVDGFHPKNLEKLATSSDGPSVIMPPVFGAVLEMLSNAKIDLTEKKVCVLSNSEIFGDNLAKVLGHRKALVSVAGPDDENLITETSQADLLVTAIGRPGFIKKEMIKKDAVIIDIGITKVGKNVKGDADFEDLDGTASLISPVPGGIGPLTIAMAFRNTLEIYKKRKGK